MDHPSQPQLFPWRLFWLLFVIGILGALAIIPIAIDLFGAVVQAAEAPSIPLPLLILIAVVQNLSMLALMVFVGLKLGQKLGLGAPLLESWLAGNAVTNQWRPSLREGFIAGLGIGVVILIGLIAVVPLLPNLPCVTAANSPSGKDSWPASTAVSSKKYSAGFFC